MSTTSALSLVRVDVGSLTALEEPVVDGETGFDVDEVVVGEVVVAGFAVVTADGAVVVVAAVVAADGRAVFTAAAVAAGPEDGESHGEYGAYRE
jgi:hypothetical protein